MEEYKRKKKTEKKRLYNTDIQKKNFCTHNGPQMAKNPNLIKTGKKVSKNHQKIEKKIESTFTFVTFNVFFLKKKFAHLQIRPQMARSTDSIKTG